MTREQKLFETAREFLASLSDSELSSMLRNDGYRIKDLDFIIDKYEALSSIVSTYEGEPFSDGHDEQDISPDAPNYNPKVSGRL